MPHLPAISNKRRQHEDGKDGLIIAQLVKIEEEYESKEDSSGFLRKPSSIDRELSNSKKKMQLLSSRLENHLWPAKMLHHQQLPQKKRLRQYEGETSIAGMQHHH